jgi:hypothetical protein
MTKLVQGIAALGIPLSLLVAVGTAHAELKVRMPTVDYRELELEHNGLVTFGHKGTEFDRAQNYTNEIAYGLTPWWQVELEQALVANPGTTLRNEAFAFENTFQLTEPGEYFFNFGFFAEYEHVMTRGSANALTFGPIIQKELPSFLGLSTLHTVNLFFSHGVGANASRATGFTYAWQSVARLHPLLSPGVELYGTISDLGNSGRYNRQFHTIGPVLVGTQRLGNGLGRIRYEVGYQFGLTSNSPTGAVRWRLEYEIAF